MKIMFLDIDGVLCTLRSQYAYGERLLMEAWDITCCQMIRRLCAANGYKIVISSTWRNDSKVRVYCAVYGLIDYLCDDWKTPRGAGIRGLEVQAWIKSQKEDVEYVIVDDDKDFLEEQINRLVYVDDNYNGFSVKNFDKADELMGNKFREYMLRRNDDDRQSITVDNVIG